MTRRRKIADVDDDVDDDHSASSSQPSPSRAHKRTKSRRARNDSSAPSSSSSSQVESALDQSDDNVLPTYREGAIVSMRLHNFMTYDDCEIQPGPGLNLVLGPNGSGKSSLVSAICVGLNGNTKILGRATKVSDYIKTGKKEAFVEIELYRKFPKKNKVIKRILRAATSSSEWKIDGRIVHAEDVKRLVSDFNIKLDNLTQFLPQEKVANFSMLGPIDLLKSTQEAVLPMESVKYHKELAEQQQTSLSKQNTVETTRSHLQKLIKLNETLEKDVERLKRRKEHMAMVEILKAKKPFIEFGMQQARARQLKEGVDEKEREIAEVNAKSQPLKSTIRELEKEKSEVEKTHKEVVSKIASTKRKIESVTSRMHTTKDNIWAKQERVKELESRVETQERRKQSAQQHLERYENALQEKKSDEELDEMLRKLETSRREIDHRLSSVQTRDYDIQDRIIAKENERKAIENEINQLKNVRYQRLRAIERKFPNAFRAYQWLQQNRNQFRNEVFFVPLDVSLIEDQFGDYLEQHCPNWLLESFIFSDEEEKEMFIREVQDRQRISITAIYHPPSDVELPSNPMTMEEARKFKITHFLDQTFKAPDLVKKTISVSASVHSVAIGGNDCRVDDIFDLDPLKVGVIFTPENLYHSRRSRYSNASSTRVNSVRRATLFKGQDLHVGEEPENRRRTVMEEIDELKRERAEIATEGRTAQSERDKWRSEQAHIRSEKKLRQKLQQQINAKRREVEELQQTVDITDQKQGLLREIRQGFFEVASTATRITALMQEWHEMSIESTRAPLKRADLTIKVNSAMQELRRVEMDLNSLNTEHADLVKQFRHATDILKGMKQRAVAARAEYMEKHGITEEIFSSKLLELPSDLEEIEDMIQQEEANANSIYHDPSIIRRYEERKIEIEKKEVELEVLEQQLKNAQDYISQLEEKWLNPLKECVEKINQIFQRLCSNIGIVGEVSLNPHESDYDKYEIQIKVKFRDKEPLAVLSPQRQSGGERAVTTILYLLSLQHINKCPFRVVDEINQGMDPINERKIFMQMLESSKGQDIPQTLLISPKLLDSLVPETARNMTVIIISNGPYNISQDRYNNYMQENDLWIEAAREVAAET